MSIPVDDVRVSGDLAVARGTWTAEMTPKAQGVAPVNDGGSWIAVFARQSDGAWKMGLGGSQQRQASAGQHGERRG